MIKKGSFIELEEVCECKLCEFKVFTRGNCMYDCEFGEETYIKTVNGNVVKGIVSRCNFLCNNIDKLGAGSGEILSVGTHKS